MRAYITFIPSSLMKWRKGDCYYPLLLVFGDWPRFPNVPFLKCCGTEISNLVVISTYYKTVH